MKHLKCNALVSSELLRGLEELGCQPECWAPDCSSECFNSNRTVDKVVEEV